MSSDNPLPSSFDGNEGFYRESRLETLTRRLKEEPLVPLGILLTCWALFGATKSIRRGDHHEANRMFRRRIYAQGFTVLAMVAGSIYWQGDRDKRKELEGIMSEQKRMEKREKWIAELEARDREEKEMRERLLAGKTGQVSQVQSETRSVVEETEKKGWSLGIVDSVKNLRGKD